MFYELIDDTPSEVDGAPNEAQRPKKGPKKGKKGEKRSCRTVGVRNMGLQSRYE